MSAVPSSTASSDPGTSGNHLLQAQHHRRLSRRPAGSASGVAEMRISPQVCWKKSPRSWDAEELRDLTDMIVSASPTIKPFNTGSEMNQAMNPAV